jgi:lysozyme
MVNAYLHGIDISHYQGKISWQKVAAAGITFVYAKATEGANTKDARFVTNINGMKSNGIIRGAYHFFRPAKDANLQAANFLSVVNLLEPGDLPPALDIEVNDDLPADAIISGITTWISKVESALGRTPVIYTSAYFWNSKLGGCADFSKCPLWVAHYTPKPAPNLPNGFADFTFWQHSEKGAINGITGSVDLNRFKGNADDLKKLAGL